MFKRKIIVASIGFVFLFVKNMLDNPPHFLSSLVKFGFFAAMLALIAQFFFKRTPEQKNNASDVPVSDVPAAGIPAAGHTERLNLADYHLTKTEEYYIYAIVEKIPYKVIARNVAKSESTVKREMLLLFKRFGFQTHTNFYNHLKNIIIDYSQFTPPQPS